MRSSLQGLSFDRDSLAARQIPRNIVLLKNNSRGKASVIGNKFARNISHKFVVCGRPESEAEAIYTHMGITIANFVILNRSVIHKSSSKIFISNRSLQAPLKR